MKLRYIFALCGALAVCILAPATAAIAAGGTTVSVRVEGKSRTLLAATNVTTHGGWITKGGVAPGKCSALTGQGALDVATHHRWAGTFSQSLANYFIKTILGETDNGPKYYWSIFANNRLASTGACAVKLKRGDQLLFAATIYPEYPIAIKAPGSATVGRRFKVTVLSFSAAGKAKPLPGVTVSGSGIHATTGNGGSAVLVAGKSGKLVLKASKKGYVRAAPVTVRISS